MSIYSGQVCGWNDEFYPLSNIMRQARAAVSSVGLSNRVVGDHINQLVTKSYLSLRCRLFQVEKLDEMKSS